MPAQYGIVVEGRNCKTCVNFSAVFALPFNTNRAFTLNLLMWLISSKNTCCYGYL